MKKVLLILLILGSISFTFAQDWQTDIEISKSMALENNKHIILVFQGSDWCAPCMKLDREIWSTEAFQKHAEGNYIMLQADFPRKKANKLSKEQQEKNNQLAEKYNQNGFFPHVVILNAKGKVLGRTGYKKLSPEDYIKMLDSFKDN